MAQYTEQVNASDCYLVDFRTGAVSRGDTLQTQFVYDDTAPTTPTGKTIRLIFPATTAYSKKRIISKVPKVYVSQKSATASGSLPAGSAFTYFVDSENPPYFLVGGGTLGNWASFIVNQYADYNAGAQFDGVTAILGVRCAITEGINPGVYYAANVSVTIHSHTGTNKPYLQRTYEDVIVTSKNQYPQSGFINEKVINRFGWAFNYNASGVAAQLAQKSAKVEYYYKNPDGSQSAVQSVIIDGAQNYIDIPANTFPSGGSAGDIWWRITLTSDDDIEGTPSAWFKLTSVDSTSTPEAVSPKSVYIDGSIVNRFSWLHTISTGTAQTKYDLQYSADNGTTWDDLQSEETANTYADVSAGSLPAGAILWRVRTYNTDSVSGAWSASVPIVVHSAPAKPSISSITTTPRPVISWQCSEQQAFQVRAAGYDSGTVFGVVREFKIPVFLAPGVQTVSVRIQNSFGLWSDWAEATTTVANSSGTISIATRRVNNGVSISCTGTFERYVYYRDGEQIADTDEASYADYLSVGKHIYTVRGVNGDNYTMSAPVVEILHPTIGIISATDNIDWISLAYKRGNFPTHDITDEQEVSYQHYSGRSLPVAEIGEAVNIVHALSFTVPTDTAEKLRTLRAKKVVYKDNLGDIAIGIFNGFKQSRGAYRPSTHSFDVDVSFTITEIGGVSSAVSG